MSAITTVAALGYSLPDWFVVFLVFALVISLPFACVSLIRIFCRLFKAHKED